MTTIESVEAVPVFGGFFFDDQRAIRAGAEREGFAYVSPSKTEGFDAVREPAEAVSVVLELDDGTTATGDCAAVQYIGAGGRDRIFDGERCAKIIESEIARELEGRSAAAFSSNIEFVENEVIDEMDTEQRHGAINYGVSQALLEAAALAERTTMTEVLAETYDTTPASEPIPVYAQTGDSRRRNAEKMIIKGVDVLPHGLFNNVDKLGDEGEKLVAYLEWLSERVGDLGQDGYEPRFHVDVYGTIGELFGSPYDSRGVVEYFARLERAAEPYALQIEGPMDAENRTGQISAMAELRDALAENAVDVDIVADEWCNTIDDIERFVDEEATDVVQVKTPDLGGIQNSVKAVQYCEGTESRAYLGGSCAETDNTARACAHVALATQPIQVLAKPGMGVDEGYMIVKNEMQRTLARI